MWSPGLLEGFEVDGQVVNVSGQSRDILFKLGYLKDSNAVAHSVDTGIS